MSQKQLSVNLLLAIVLSFGFTGFGCSSSPSNSANTKPTQQPGTVGSTSVNTSTNTTPSTENSPPTVQTNPIGSTPLPNLENTPKTSSASPAPAPGSAGDYYQRGIASAKQGDLKGAEESWRKSIQLDPKNPEVHTNLGVLLQRQGKLDDAINEYKEALRLKSDDADIQMKLAVALGQQGKFEESIAQSKEAIRIKPDFAPAHVILAAGFSQQGKPDEAIESLKKARDLFKTQNQTDALVGTQIQLASLLGKQRKFDEASSEAKEVIRLKPDFAPAHVLLAEISVAQGKPEEAVTSLKKAKDLFKAKGQTDQLVGVQMQLAALLGQQKKFTEASIQAQEIVRLKPDFAPGYLLLAQVAQQQGNPEGTVTNLKKARDLFKSQGETDQQIETQLKLAFALGQQKKIDEAITQSREVITLKPDLAPAHYVLALGLAEKGKKNEAVTSLQKAKELFTTQGKTEEAARIDQIIQQLSTKQ